MRYIKNILMLVATIFFFVSCEMDIEKAYLDTEDKFGAPVLSAQSGVIVNQNNVKKESVTFNWTGASFGPEVQVEYKLYGKYGEATAELGSSYGNTITISKEDFNGKVTNELKVPKNTTEEISSYIVAKVYQTTVKEIQSNTIAYNVTTFEAPLRWLFMPGNYQGWKETIAPQFWETDGGTSVYQTLVDMSVLGDAVNVKSDFKINTAQNWSDPNWGYNEITPSWPSPVQNDLSVDLTNGRVFLFSVNTSAMTIEKTDFKSVNILGTFSEWDKNEQDLTYNPVTNVWSSAPIVFADGGDFLIRLNKSWDHKYGSAEKLSEKVTDGHDLLKGGGPNFVVPSAGTYIIELHANRTPYVLVMKKQ